MEREEEEEIFLQDSSCSQLLQENYRQIQYTSVRGGTYALGKIHMCFSTNFPKTLPKSNP